MNFMLWAWDTLTGTWTQNTNWAQEWFHLTLKLGSKNVYFLSYFFFLLSTHSGRDLFLRIPLSKYIQFCPLPMTTFSSVSRGHKKMVPYYFHVTHPYYHKLPLNPSMKRSSGMWLRANLFNLLMKSHTAVRSLISHTDKDLSIMCGAATLILKFSLKFPNYFMTSWIYPALKSPYLISPIFPYRRNKWFFLWLLWWSKVGCEEELQKWTNVLRQELTKGTPGAKTRITEKKRQLKREHRVSEKIKWTSLLLCLNMKDKIKRDFH